MNSDFSIDFILVGPFKTGTSWIYEYLKRHPQVNVPIKVKETYFFDKKCSKGTSWYLSHFEKGNSSSIFGEVSPSYFHSIDATNSIYKNYSNCKILITLRDPIERLISYYGHMLQRGDIRYDMTFIDALHKKEILVESSKYYSHLWRWVDVFGKENVYILFYEDLQASNQLFSKTLCSILDIDFIDPKKFELMDKVNPTKIPTNYFVARLLTATNRFLRHHGFHGIVNFVKRVGLQSLLFKQSFNKKTLEIEDMQYAFDLIKDELQLLGSEFTLDIEKWRSNWIYKGLDVF
ncbi:MAG: sulfotransferase [Cyanobacteria bacterium P01_A01_bin.123]